MPQRHRIATVTTVTIRDAIADLLRNAPVVPDRASFERALREAGVEGVDPSLIDTAIGHYADTATVGDAELLADLAIEASPIPFDPVIDRLPLDDTPPEPPHDVDPMHDIDRDDPDDPDDDGGDPGDAPAPNGPGSDDEPERDTAIDTAYGAGADDDREPVLDEPLDAVASDPMRDELEAELETERESVLFEPAATFDADTDHDGVDTFGSHREIDVGSDADGDHDPAGFDGFE